MFYQNGIKMRKSCYHLSVAHWGDPHPLGGAVVGAAVVGAAVVGAAVVGAAVVVPLLPPQALGASMK